MMYYSLNYSTLLRAMTSLTGHCSMPVDWADYLKVFSSPKDDPIRINNFWPCFFLRRNSL